MKIGILGRQGIVDNKRPSISILHEFQSVVICNKHSNKSTYINNSPLVWYSLWFKGTFCHAAVKKSTYPCTGCYCTQITSMSQGRKFVTSVHKILHSTFINHKLMTLMQKGGMWHLFTFTTIQTFKKTEL